MTKRRTSELPLFFSRKLERHKTVQKGVLSLVGGAHSAAELLDNAVVRNGLAINEERLALCATILEGQTATSQCSSGKGEFQLLPNRLATGASRSGHTPDIKMPRDCLGFS